MKRMIKAVVLCALGLSGLQLHAQTPALENGVMHIPRAMVFVPEGNVLYSDLELALRADGNLEISSWQQSRSLMLASVQSVSVDSIVSHGEQAVVIIQGFRSAECVQLEDVQVNRERNHFEIVFAEKPVPENVRCIGGKVPFDRALFLETRDLEPGEVVLNVHNLQVAFTLED